MENYEQKYKQALDAFRKFRDAYKTTDHSVTYKEMKKLFANVEASFPELRESEDEKIRKALIEGFKSHSSSFSTFGGISDDDILAWLKKQGEQKFEMKSAEESLGIDSETYNKIVDECIYGEQKPVECNSVLMTLDEAIEHCDSKSNNTQCGLEHKQLAQWLRELKEYKEQKPAWSEEDEARFESCIKVLQTSDGYDTINAKWLKSLKDRYTWKPSDEQMDALKGVQEGVFRLGILESLYQDLKKLREE